MAAVPFSAALDDADTRRPQHLEIDHWLARSLLQKAIRRGEVEIAERAALTVHALCGPAIWQRFLVIAFEDVGAASPEVVVETVWASLAALAGEAGPAPAVLARKLAEVAKDRCADFLICSGQHHPKFQQARDESGSATREERLERVASADHDLVTRAAAAWHASGIGCGERVGRGDLDGLTRTYRAMGVPSDLVDAARVAAVKTRDAMPLMVPLIWHPLHSGSELHVIEGAPRPSPLVDGIPAYAFDKHTRLGKQAIQRFARENEAVRACLEEHVPDYRHGDATCMAAFYVDGAPVKRRLIWTGCHDIEAVGRESDMLRAGVPVLGIDPLLRAVEDNIEHLDDIRARLFRAARG